MEMLTAAHVLNRVLGTFRPWISILKLIRPIDPSNMIQCFGSLPVEFLGVHCQAGAVQIITSGHVSSEPVFALAGIGPLELACDHTRLVLEHVLRVPIESPLESAPAGSTSSGHCAFCILIRPGRSPKRDQTSRTTLPQSSTLLAVLEYGANHVLFQVFSWALSRSLAAEDRT